MAVLGHRCKAIQVYQAAKMSATPKRKLCWNCDGAVSLAVDQCTYCGASLKEGAAPKRQPKKPIDPLAPPYALRTEAQSDAPTPPFDAIGRTTATASSLPSDSEEDVSNESLANPSETRAVLSSLMLLLGGSVFFLFGLVLWLFSQNGVFTLHWNAAYWYLYLFGGVALLLMGWRALGHLEEMITPEEQ